MWAFRDVLASPNFYRSWQGSSGSSPLVCFADATPHRVAFASNSGVWSRPLPRPFPILNSELAGYAYLTSHLQFSNNLILCSDNMAALYSIERGFIKSAYCNYILQSLASNYLRGPFFLSLVYIIPSLYNPADKCTHF